MNAQSNHPTVKPIAHLSWADRFGILHKMPQLPTDDEICRVFRVDYNELHLARICLRDRVFRVNTLINSELYERLFNGERSSSLPSPLNARERIRILMKKTVCCLLPAWRRKKQSKKFVGPITSILHSKMCQPCRLQSNLLLKNTECPLLCCGNISASTKFRLDRCSFGRTKKQG